MVKAAVMIFLRRVPHFFACRLAAAHG